MATRESHPITDENLDKWINVVEQEISKFRGGQDIEELLKNLSPEEKYRVLPKELDLVYALRNAACFYWYFVDLLVERTGIKKTSPGPAALQETAKWISAYSLFVMASSVQLRCEKMLRGQEQAALAKLDPNFELVVGNGFKNDFHWSLNNYASAITATAPSATGKLVQCVNDIISLSRDYWKGVAEKAKKIAESNKELLALVENTTFQHGKFIITGTKIEVRKEIQVSTWSPVEPEEVVGDQDVTTFLCRLCDRIALYDPVIGKNPICEFGGITESTLLDGPPGVGKTHRMRLCMTRLSRRSEQIHVPVISKSLTADQVKSEWYGKTAQLISELLKTTRDPLLLALLFVDDIDLLLTGDRNSAGVNGADMDLMKAMMDFFSGTGTNYIGNYLAIAATNKPTATDDALRQRFVYRAIINGPRTTEDYADLTSLELRRFAKTGLLKINQGKYKPLSRVFSKTPQIISPGDPKNSKATWDDIGQLCAELNKKDSRFTGRSVKNAIQVAVAQAADFDIPEEWFINPSVFRTQSWEKRLEMLKALYKEVTVEKIMSALEYQFNVEERYAREAYNKRIETVAEEVAVTLEAQKRVRGKKQ